MAGRPLKFPTVEDLEKKINEYFDSGYSIVDGQKKKTKIFTVMGLCNHLDVDRVTLLDYATKSDEFSNTIKRAKSRVEEDIEYGSLTGHLNPTSCIFNLKNNFGWKDKTEVDNNTKIDFNFSKKEIEGMDNQKLKDLKDNLLNN